jgi:hypothetical protein
MTGPPKPAAGGYLRFLAEVVGVTAIVALLGSVPTWRLAGGGGIAAMLAGCGIAALASAFGAVPIALAEGAPAAKRTSALLSSMVLRLAMTFLLGVVALLSGRLERAPLLLWIAIGYAVLLVVDTRYAVRGTGRPERTEKKEEKDGKDEKDEKEKLAAGMDNTAEGRTQSTETPR